MNRRAEALDTTVKVEVDRPDIVLNPISGYRATDSLRTSLSMYIAKSQNRSWGPNGGNARIGPEK